MNRNVESHFAHIPSADIPRSRFDCSQDVKFTFNVGDLVPWFVFEVLPGDTIDIETSKVVRLQTLLTPVMDNIYLDTYFFFVPNRLVWEHWKNFMGESGNAWLPTVEYVVPSMSDIDNSTTEGSGAVQVGDALDYMGVPVGVSAPYGSATTPQINALPYRAYQLIWNEWFRDQNVQDAININFGDSLTPIRSEPRGCLKVCKYHDYFTSVLPSPQRGPSVAITINQAAGSNGLPVNAVAGSEAINPQSVPTTYNLTSSTSDYYKMGSATFVTPDGTDTAYRRTSGAAGYSPNNLYAQVPSTGSPLSFNVNNLRLAVQTQKFYERLARGGSRYIEIIKSMFNVNSPDARMQRPEYLGGNRIPISIHQICNQSQGESDFLGDLGAMSLTTDRNGDFVKSFTEHGFIIGLCCARYDHSYPQGLNKLWTRSTRESYYWPVFAHLGEQAVYKREIWFDGLPAGNASATGNSVFGYQERWAEYRYQPNRVAGEMRPGVSGTLDSWHFADYYESVPSYSSSWIKEDKTNVDRTLAVTSSTSNQLFCDIYVRNYASRPMPLYSIPGLVDHF